MVLSHDGCFLWLNISAQMDKLRLYAKRFWV